MLCLSFSGLLSSFSLSSFFALLEDSVNECWVRGQIPLVALAYPSSLVRSTRRNSEAETMFIRMNEGER